jgi:hypothetical protein
MEPSSSPFWRRTLAALVRRRESRGEWLYTICAILVVLYALSVLYGIGAEAPPSGPRLSDFVTHATWLSLAVTVAFVQVWRQTLLGWLLLLTGFAALALFGLVIFYSLYKDGVFDAWPLIIAAPLIAICGALLWHRPTAR